MRAYAFRLLRLRRIEFSVHTESAFGSKADIGYFIGANVNLLTFVICHPSYSFEAARMGVHDGKQVRHSDDCQRSLSRRNSTTSLKVARVGANLSSHLPSNGSLKSGKHQ